MRRLILAVAVVASVGCDAASMGAFMEGFSRGMQQNATPMPTAKLMVFGGPNNDVYLGCLNCSEFHADSLFNEYGSFGNRFSGTSILNKFSAYGSRFGAHSPCNPYASNPPIVVDANGRAYGRLTVSTTNAKRVQWPSVNQWLNGVCAG